jgi:hypothetical protein
MIQFRPSGGVLRDHGQRFERAQNPVTLVQLSL